MKKKLLVLVIVGLLVVGLTGCNNDNNLQNDYSDKINEATSLVRVPLAKEDIPKGAIITSDMIEIKEINKNEISEDTIINIDQVLGKTSIIDIKKKEIFTNLTIK